MEPTLKWLDPDLIVANWDLNPRERDENHILAIARHMNDNGYDDDFPIIVYYLEEGPIHPSLNFAATGYHRLAAAMLKHSDYPNLPLKEVYVELHTGTMDDVVITMMTDNWQWSPSVNQSMGKMPSAFELRAMRYRLMLFPDNFKKSDRNLAKEWGCDKRAIGTIRGEIINRLQTDVRISIPYFTEAYREEILRIAERGMYISTDGNEHPRVKSDPLQAMFEGMSDYEILQKEWNRIDGLIKQALKTLGFNNLQQAYMVRRLGAPRKNISWEDKDYKKGIRDGTAFLKIISEPELDPNVENIVKELELYNKAIEVYKPIRRRMSLPYLTSEAENVAKEFDYISSADWEEKERSERIKQLRSLINRFKDIYAAESKTRAMRDKEEEEKRTALELKRTGDATEDARKIMWDTYEVSELPKYTTQLAFAREACAAMGYKISENDDSPDNVVLGKEGALVKNLPLDEVIRWRSTFAGITAAINNKLEWVLKLIPRPEECFKSLKLSLSTTGSLEQVDGQTACEMYNITQEQFDALKQQAFAESCDVLRNQNQKLREDASSFFSAHCPVLLDAVGWEGLWKAALALPQFSDLSEETFTGVHDDEDFNDYTLLLKEKHALTRFENDVRIWQSRSWIKDLLPPPPVADNRTYTKINRIFILAEHENGNEDEIHVGNSDGADCPLHRVPKEVIEKLLTLVQNVEKK